MPMRELTLYLPTELDEALQEIVRRTKQSQDTIVHEALRTYLRQQQQERPEQQERQLPRSIGIGESDLQAVDIEDWLAANWRPA